jgi:hypothetical protein
MPDTFKDILKIFPGTLFYRVLKLVRNYIGDTKYKAYIDNWSFVYPLMYTISMFNQVCKNNHLETNVTIRPVIHVDLQKVYDNNLNSGFFSVVDHLLSSNTWNAFRPKCSVCGVAYEKNYLETIKPQILYSGPLFIIEFLNLTAHISMNIKFPCYLNLNKVNGASDVLGHYNDKIYVLSAIIKYNTNHYYTYIYLHKENKFYLFDDIALGVEIKELQTENGLDYVILNGISQIYYREMEPIELEQWNKNKRTII